MLCFVADFVMGRCAFSWVIVTVLLARPARTSPTDGIPQYVVVISWGGEADAQWVGDAKIEGGRIHEAVPWMKPYGRVPQRGVETLRLPVGVGDVFRPCHAYLVRRGEKSFLQAGDSGSDAFVHGLVHIFS